MNPVGNNTVFGLTPMNCLGYVPGLGVVAGVKHAVTGLRALQNRNDGQPYPVKVLLLTRGMIEISGAGSTFLPVDVAAQIARYNQQ